MTVLARMEYPSKARPRFGFCQKAALANLIVPAIVRDDGAPALTLALIWDLSLPQVSGAEGDRTLNL
jgi:hypothetical protein